MDFEISVIIPFYNAHKYIFAAVESILSQSVPVNEIIIIDDASECGLTSVKFAQDKIKIIRFSENKGVAAARNEGIRQAKGNILAFLDADDLWCAQKLSNQLEILHEDPRIEAVYGYVKQFASPELPLEAVRKYCIDTEARTGYLAGSLLVKKEAFLRAGFFNEDFRTGEFIEWRARAIRKGITEAVIEDVVLLRRIHGENLTIRERKRMAEDFMKMAIMKIKERKTESGQS